LGSGQRLKITFGGGGGCQKHGFDGTVGALCNTNRSFPKGFAAT
jgi:hypothetical protein